MTGTNVSFVVGSGRCGTYSLYKALAGLPGVEARHEPWCETIQVFGCLWHAGILSHGFTKSCLERLYGDLFYHSQAEHFVVVGNKESWLLGPLRRTFPEARFAWLVRDGRKVCLSCYHKLAGEHYDDRPVRLLAGCLADPVRRRPPPMEKPYWWPLPKSSSERSEFVKWDRWQRVCWHYDEICREIKCELGEAGQLQNQFKLESLVKDVEEVALLFTALGLNPDDRVEQVYQALQKPLNVIEPVNYQMTPEQKTVYRQACAEIHEWLGYGWKPLDQVEYDDG